MSAPSKLGRENTDLKDSMGIGADSAETFHNPFAQFKPAENQWFKVRPLELRSEGTRIRSSAAGGDPPTMIRTIQASLPGVIGFD